ncbi:uncharacterized protein LOC111384467 [Olea europaea var. sylvestris]|uniref:uncharacterized protein LOC111384467 n=1 Tax=Olea europaea var. sylvestris TaxID=158386 RepID=UPI000C1D8044|nr:uncharacterized protein LOC111384467 [Olea europaea var. sylvestris]
MYSATANGLVEAFNKTLCSLLKKVVSKSKRDWHEKIRKVLWADRTPTQATPYALVYGVEAILPLECQISSLRIAIQEGLTTEENVHLRLEELEALDKKRLEAQMHLECYQARMAKSFNKKDQKFMISSGSLAGNFLQDQTGENDGRIDALQGIDGIHDSHDTPCKYSGTINGGTLIHIMDNFNAEDEVNSGTVRANVS